MLDRLNVYPLLLGHMKSFSNQGRSGIRPDWALRLGLPAASLLVGALAWRFTWSVPAASALLTGVALLAGASLSSFAFLSSLRLRLTDRPDDAWLDIERDSLDEGATHLLLVILLGVLDAATIIIGTNATPMKDVSGGIRSGPWAWVALSVSTYIGLLFVVLVPRLYSAYVEMNHVRAELSGLHRSLRASKQRDDARR